ncbi:MAG: hypothetical protein M3296_04720 [Actinomycetota bacterium]|nr:hypothetical protein [Actinomycetota bacterium]
MPGPPPQPPEPPIQGAAVRFEATVHPGAARRSLQEVADLDLDRVPDPKGGVRVLVTAQDATELLARGYEVLLVRALPVQPLDRGMVGDEDSADAWLEEQTRGIERHEGS